MVVFQNEFTNLYVGLTNKQGENNLKMQMRKNVLSWMIRACM